MGLQPSPEYLKHLEELRELREVFNTSNYSDISVDAYLKLAIWEIRDCLYALPPDAAANGRVEDGYHAGCCAVRAYSFLRRAQDRLNKVAIAAQISNVKES